MRRRDREMNREFGIEVIDRATYGIVSVIDNEANLPYSIPLSVARDGETLYFHSAMDGKKVRIFESSPSVSVVFVGETKIPEIYTKEELDEMVKDKSKAGAFISKVFTTEFESTIVLGKVRLIDDREEKINAMKVICEKYTPIKMEYFSTAIESGLSRTNVYAIDIEEITAKRKKYDRDGKEMKWGRME
ncbi:MAG: pyridoxamine 5'-phosphate oxidase family protein [Tissierellaceae bacterium]